MAGNCRSATIPDPQACNDPRACSEAVLAPGAVGVDASADAPIDASVDAPVDASVDAPPSKPVALVSGQSSPLHLALDANNVYWTNATDGTIAGCAKTGCAAATQLATDFTGAVWSCPVTGCAGVPVPIATGQTYASVIAVDGPNLYWSNGGHFQTGIADGEIVRCAAASCAATRTVLASAILRPWGLAVDATDVYFTVNGSGTVMRVAK